MQSRHEEEDERSEQLEDDADAEDDLDRHARELDLGPPKPIQRLEESVVNRIAAGEIIHRPANALKELIENSLDAGATMIKITLKDGGMKLLQIQDNGSGVQRSDLPLLCERFATSKLRDFDDLSRMSTFGFRGEALASISYVSATMTVVSKTRDANCAYKASYSQGALVPPKPGMSVEAKPCAGNDGTLITAEELFYNVPARRRALKSAAEEYNRALDVVGRYAIHFGGRGVGFMCKKASSNVTDLSSPASATATTLDTIRLLHGSTVARELVRLRPHQDVRLGFSAEGWISGANWSGKRTQFMCFINHRLVDCPLLKRSFEALYSNLLPKGGHPWLYISLEIDPDRVDVNVHPTKREVHFLDEEAIVEQVCMHAQDCLAGANSSRTFQFTQALLPGASTPSSNKERRAAQLDLPASTPSQMPAALPTPAPKPYAQHMVRVDAKTRTLDGMLLSQTQQGTQPLSAKALGKKRAAEEMDSENVQGNEDEDPGYAASLATTERAQNVKSRIPESECMLTSVRELRAEVIKRRHVALTDILQNHTFVGVVDVELGISLLQHSTKLYLVNHSALIEEFAYQLVLRQFGNFARVRLDPPPLVRDLVALGLDCEPYSEKALLPREDIIERITETLLSRAEMLDEYFSFRLNSELGTLETLPALLPRFAPPVDRLPTLLFRLGPQVDWTDEKRCFESCARELALAHVPASAGASAAEENDEERERWEIQHAFFANMGSRRGAFIPPKFLLEQDVVQVANLPDLYRVFERC